jgi:hypothetical protein
MPPNTRFSQAHFIPQSGPDNGNQIQVLFNPVSLQYTVTNTLRRGRGNDTKQYVGQSTGKLSLELVFDTSHTGEDVRTKTIQIQRFMMADAQKVPPVVLFEWGTFSFRGVAESYRETMDFFAPNGVPLRSTLSLSFSEQDIVFQNQRSGVAPARPNAVDVPGGQNLSPAQASSKAGDQRAQRQVGTDNNAESLRAGSGDSLTVNGAASLNPPVSFASEGSAGASAGSAGAGLGFSAGAGLGASAGAAGGAASAGVAASAGAFDGLRAVAGGPADIQLNLNALIPQNKAADLATDAGAAFVVGGKAAMESPASLRADVGLNTNIRSILDFDP